MDIFPAHIRTDEINGEPRDVVQSVTAHCRATAEYASRSLAPVGLAGTGYLAGLLHDCGKFTRAFSDYIRAAHRGEEVRRGSVNHTFAGAQYLLKRFHRENNTTSEHLTSELIAYAIGAHHGLFDLMKNHQPYGFPHRMEAENAGCEEAIRNFLIQCADEAELDTLFQRSRQEVTLAFQKIRSIPGCKGQHRDFYLALLSRLILSAVIEGDRRDTAEFEHHFTYPQFPEDRNQLWSESLAFMEQKLGEFEHRTPIQNARAEISDLCRRKAAEPGGIYRLNVPTGGGKTLASLRYALAHAAAHNKQRIFFVIPLLSIIDQNSKVLREYLPRQDIILEHHSNVVHTEEDGKNLDPRELLAENWSAPVIITTLVQLLNTLFSGKTTSIRRFQGLCGSIIIFDEVQTVPTNMLSLFNLAINFLARFCGSTVILCSATQPCLEQAAHPLIDEISDLVPWDQALWSTFRRTHMQRAEPCNLAELPEFLLEQLSRHRSVLVVCNKKDEAGFLCQALSTQVSHLFHLSASMCMAHRRETLDRLTAVLDPENGVKSGILCVSTQVIEAGVDISFDCVVRLLAGMDSAVQAAGRCNRNGESKTPAPVYLLPCKDEKLAKLKEIQAARHASVILLEAFASHPENYQDDLTSDASIAFYYRTLYRGMAQRAQDFPLSDGQISIFELLSRNCGETQFLNEHRFILNQSFQTAGQAFHVFDENTVDVLVPYGAEGLRLIAELCSERAEHDFQFVKDILEAAKPYTISLFQYQFNKLKEDGALYPTAGQQALVLNGDYYNSSTGLSVEPWTDQTTEVNSCNIPML